MGVRVILVANCVIIADDLTGACDSALQFRKCGVPSVVHIMPDAQIDQLGVHAFSTDSRNLEASEIEARVRHLAHRLKDKPGLIFKKVDSLLRGSPATEIAATFEAFGCDVAVITPAFPALGRRVFDGRLHVDGDASWTPMDIRALLRGGGLNECHHVGPGVLADTLAAGYRYVSVDSATAEDLDIIAREALRCNRKVLWAGSAGLASAVAELISSGFREDVQSVPTRCGPVLFIVGSEHPVTAAQMDELLVTECALAASNSGVRDALAARKSVLLRVDMSRVGFLDLRSLLDGVPWQVGAVFLSGGDTASLCCRALDVSAIRIEGEIAPGVPWGTTMGGSADGISMITKSGAFGTPDVLVKVVQFFACPQP